MYNTTMRIGASYITAKGEMRHSEIINLMQDCCGFQLSEIEPLQDYFTAHNVGMYLVSRQLEIIRLPKYGEQITVSTGIYECKPTYGFRNTMLYGEGGDPCVISNAMGAFVNLASGRPVKIPQDVLDKIDYQPRQEMEYLPRKIQLPDCQPIIADEMPIYQYHIDVNRHVNNAMYLELAEESLPTDFAAKRIRRIRIEYKSPAKYGDKVVPHIYVGEDVCAIALNSPCNVTFAIVEFST